MGIIYLFTTPVGHYVGQTIRSLDMRVNEHISSAYRLTDVCPKLCEAIRQFGMEQIHVEILEICSDAELNEREKFYISIYHSHYPYGYNMTNGGAGWSQLSAEARESIANSLRKYKNYPVPMYVSFYKKNDIEGFRIIKPHCEPVILCSSKLTLDEKHKIALEIYQMTPAKISDYNSQRKLQRNKHNKNNVGDDYPLPEYLSYSPVYVGFVVRYPNCPQRKFNNRYKTFDEHYMDALEYLEYLKNGGKPIAAKRLYDIYSEQIVLEKYIQKTPHGLLVKYPNFTKVWFESKNSARNYERALEYLNRCKRMQFND